MIRAVEDAWVGGGRGCSCGVAKRGDAARSNSAQQQSRARQTDATIVIQYTRCTLHAAHCIHVFVSDHGGSQALDAGKIAAEPVIGCNRGIT